MTTQPIALLLASLIKGGVISPPLADDGGIALHRNARSILLVCEKMS